MHNFNDKTVLLKLDNSLLFLNLKNDFSDLARKPMFKGNNYALNNH